MKPIWWMSMFWMIFGMVARAIFDAPIETFYFAMTVANVGFMLSIHDAQGH